MVDNLTQQRPLFDYVLIYNEKPKSIKNKKNAKPVKDLEDDEEEYDKGTSKKFKEDQISTVSSNQHEKKVNISITQTNPHDAHQNAVIDSLNSKFDALQTMMLQYSGLFDLVQKGLVPAQKTAIDKPEDDYYVEPPAEIRPETKTPKSVKATAKKSEPESAPAE